MKGARLILPGCIGFFTPDPDAYGELTVTNIRHYKVECLTRMGETVYIPLRSFEVLTYPKPTNGTNL